jgi:hypothetical protein
VVILCQRSYTFRLAAIISDCISFNERLKEDIKIYSVTTAI